jgi:hypothetical protein
MTRAGPVWLLTGVLMSVGACHSGTAPSSRPDVQSTLADGTWRLAVDRAVPAPSSATTLASTPLPESLFLPVSAGPRYQFNVSEHGAQITVMEPHLVARLSEATTDQLSYNLTEGAFAGGRIVVWQASGSLQGELTIFGSGVPIVQSERGTLSRAF